MRTGILFWLVVVLAAGCHKIPYAELTAAPQQAVIDGVTYTLDAFACPDYIMGVYDPTPLNASVTLSGDDSTRSFPSSLRLDRLWAIKSQGEIWEAALGDPDAHAPPYSIRYRVGDGPKWPAEITISVAARLRSDDGRSWLLRDPDVYILNPE